MPDSDQGLAADNPASQRSPPSRDISSIMRSVHSSDTLAERTFSSAVRERGVEYQVNMQELPGKPDFVFPGSRLAVFIDGDFWHGNQWKRRGLTCLEEQFRKAASRDYWLRKIRRNMERDCASTSALLAQGWTVTRLWESDLRRDLRAAVETALYPAGPVAANDTLSMLPQKTFAEFFAGIGLMRLGLERQGWRIAFANDIDAEKYEMYGAQFNDAAQHFVLDDVHMLSADAVPPVTLATASFPCNDLSLAGGRQGLVGSQSSAFWGFVRLLEELGSRRPPLVLLENVPGFLTSHGGADFRDALLALNRLGYLVDAFMVDAVSFVPQSRPRLFVVALPPIHTGGSEVRETSHFYGSEVRPQALADFILTHPEIQWSIRPLPAPPRARAELRDVLEDLPADAPEWWSPKRATYLLDQMSPRHRSTAETMIQGHDWSFGTVFRRVRYGKSMAELRTDGIAGCLRTPRGGSGRQILFKAGQGQYFARLLIPRECARLMGADDFIISAPFNQALFGFGDAVCVPVVEWIATYYLNPVVNELIHGRPLVAAR